MKTHYKIISILLILIVISAGCITLNWHSEKRKVLSHYFWFNDVNGEYIYFPLVVNDKNETIIDVNEYSFQSGDGEIGYVFLNNTKMLNISAHTSDIEIRAEKDITSIDIENVAYYPSFQNKSGDEKNTAYVKMYYSGENRCYMASTISIEEENREHQIILGPTYLSHGWNSVKIYYEAIIAD